MRITDIKWIAGVLYRKRKKPDRRPNINNKWVAGVLMAAAFCILLSCEREQQNNRPPATSEESVTSSVESVSLSAWVVDWQLAAGIDDYDVLASRLNHLQLFALYFNEEDALHFTPELQAELPALLERARNVSEADVYLTVVNDVWHQDGTAVQKDATLVTRLTATEQSRLRHVQELVEAAAVYHFDGLEIDYERIAETDWDNLVIFYKELYEQLNARGMKLRILFEPRAPIEELAGKLPEGPEYVMMAYNLYGSHSGPGPKADEAFLRQLARRAEDVPGGMGMALSTGGFAWTEEGRVTAITEMTGERLARQAQSELSRDPDSGAVYFDYTDEEGQRHTVWYADEGTFERWIETLKEEGVYRIAIWRLGDLGLGTLKYLSELE